MVNRFLFLTFDFSPNVGGIETRTMSYVKEMVGRGNDLVIVHLLNPADRLRILGARSRSIESFYGAKLVRYPYSVQTTLSILQASLKDSSFRDREVVHVFTGANTVIGLMYVVLGRLARKQTGVSVFGKDFLASRPSKLFFVPLILSLSIASHVMVNSISTLKHLPPRFRKKASVLYPGVDPNILGAGFEPRRETKRGRILFVGRLVKRKGLVELLKAFELVSKSNSTVRLVIVGDGPFRPEFEGLVRESSVANRVEMKGTLTGQPLYLEYASCDVFVMPSKTTSVDTEGFGMVFLEAAYFARPAVGTRSGGIPEAVVDGETGLLVEQGDIEGLALKIKTLLVDEELSERLGQNARQRVLSGYTWEKATENFLNMYRSGSRPVQTSIHSSPHSRGS